MTATKHVCPPDHKHGATITCYSTHSCRCITCKQAWTAYRARREGREVTLTLRLNPGDLPLLAAALRRHADALRETPGAGPARGRIRTLHNLIATWHRNHIKETR